MPEPVTDAHTQPHARVESNNHGPLTATHGLLRNCSLAVAASGLAELLDSRYADQVVWALRAAVNGAPGQAATALRLVVAQVHRELAGES